MQHPYFYIYNKIKKIDFGKFRVFSLNFNLLSIIFSLILIYFIERLYDILFIDINDFKSQIPFVFLFLKNTITDINYIFCLITIFFNFILFLYSFFSKKFYLVNINNLDFGLCVLSLTLNIVFFAFIFLINYSLYYFEVKFILIILISSIQILLISTAFFFNLSFAIKNLKLKIEIKTDYDHLISKEDVLKRKVHLKGEQIECFQYGKITLDICDNAFFYKKEKYPLNVVSEYLNSKNMIISDLSFEDFEVLKMLKY